jgi:hypothetical protein
VNLDGCELNECGHAPGTAGYLPEVPTLRLLIDVFLDDADADVPFFKLSDRIEVHIRTRSFEMSLNKQRVTNN